MFWRVDPSNLKPGQLVDGWRIVRRIGSGGYAVVYEVEKDGKRFAMKMACPRDGRKDAQADARARREVICLQQLTHRYILRMWAHGRWPDPRSGTLYIVVDLVDGYTLGEWSRRTYPTLHEVAVLFMKLFEALEYMHGRGVFHRDLSLRNILVTRQGEPVIIDFGAADYAASEALTDAPLPPCTPRNRSPEALKFWRENHLNPEARYPFQATDDIFALGANLYDVLTDPTPDLSEDRPPLNSPVLPPSPFKSSGGRIPPELSAYVMMLLNPQPEERPATAKDARGPLEEFAKMEGPEWWGTRVHPIAAQLPPEPPEGALIPGVAAQAEGPREPVPSHPSAVRGAWAAALHRLCRGWLRPALLGPLALVVLVAAVATSFLLLKAQPPPAPVLAEKPTNRPAQLPSSPPTQQEASPSVKQPENSPTLTTTGPTAQKAGPRRVLSKAQRCALLVFTAAWLEAGCAGVQKPPDPEPCPQEAMDAMRKELGWRLDRWLLVVVDVNKGRVPRPSNEYEYEDKIAVFNDGPVTGELSEAEGKAPAGMRLEGHLWSTGDMLYGRYRRAFLPGGHTVPICVEIASGSKVGTEAEPGSKPGAIVALKEQDALAVTLWR